MSMPPVPPGPDPARHRIVWDRAIRIIASRYPPIDLFERVSPDPRLWEVLIEAEMLTNPRVRDEVGAIRLVPPEERIAGPNASWVMAAFTHLNPKGSRFSDGSYGVYYAAHALETAVRETAYHFARFAADSGDGVRHEDMRVLVGALDAELHDVASLPEATRAAVLHPDDYTASRALATRLRAAGSEGVVYPSVRHAGGTCVGVFRPKAVGRPSQEGHIQLHYDGTRVARWFDYLNGRWVAL
jgi:hypothetical protein